MKRSNYLFLAMLFCGIQMSAQLAVQIATPAEAVLALVGPNLVVSNISFTGDPTQLGIYSNAVGNFPIQTGIILSTDGAQDVVLGSVPAGLTSQVNGEPDLLTVANSVPPMINQTFTVGSVNDVAILEFDFISTGPSLSFNYVFGSDEYLEWVNSTYNDVFGFFISGPGITGPFASPAGFPGGAMNIAGVPNSNPFLPITVSSVNDQLNTTYYLDNVNDVDIQLDGYTVSLMATATLECGETYHMKLAIADGSDEALKSIVGFQAGSFNIQGSSIEAFANDPLAALGPTTLVEGCIDGSLVLHPPSCAADGQTVELLISGTSVNGLDYATIPSSIDLVGEDIIIPITPTLDLLNDEGTETLDIAMVYVNLDGELDTVYTTIDILDYLSPSVDVGTVYICGETVNATAVPSNGLAPYTYTWFDDSTGNSHTFVTGDAGNYSVEATDFCGTTFSTSFDVIEPTPFVVIPFINNCYGIPTGDIASGGALPYDVVFAEDSLNRNGYSFTADYTGLYTVNVTDQCGSTGETTIRVEVCETKIPNIFTPNGDGKNDTFEIFGVQGFRGSRLQIFDRWGNVVLDDKDYENDWSGRDLADGVYYYIFTRVDGKIHSGNFEKLATK